MRSLKVHGLACPWNVQNSWNEIIRPGAFKQFIADLKESGLDLPMGHMHDEPAGHWTDLFETDEGLMASGVITEPWIIRDFKRGYLPELSVTWGHNDPLTGAMTYKRFNSKDHSAKAFICERNIPVRDVVTVTSGNLLEISLVDSGAFPGTWLRESVRG